MNFQRSRDSYSMGTNKGIYGNEIMDHNIDMTIINTRMFGIMFEINLLFASFKISTFMDKSMFIHTSDKL